MKRLFILMCVAAGLSACATKTAKPARAPAGSAPATSYSVTRLSPAAAAPTATTDYTGTELSAMAIERVPFRAGVSSTTVEKMALEQGCTGTASQGAGLMTPQGPVEIYRMICDSNRVFMARCEFRQCRPMSVAPAGGYGAPAEGAQSASRSQLGQREVPQLVVSWGCGRCKANERVPALIAAGYARAAQAAGYKVSQAEKARVSIMAFSERRSAMRVMFGKLAGRDTLATQTVFRGQTMMATESATESTMNMEMVSTRVGEQTFRQLTPRSRQ